MAKIIELRGNRFYRYDTDDVFTFETIFNSDGEYIGQNQDDVMDGGILFIGAEIIDSKPCVNGEPIAPLTKEEMDAAKAASLKTVVKNENDTYSVIMGDYILSSHHDNEEAAWRWIDKYNAS